MKLENLTETSHKHKWVYKGGEAKCSCGKYVQPDGTITNTPHGLKESVERLFENIETGLMKKIKYIYSLGDDIDALKTLETEQLFISSIATQAKKYLAMAARNSLFANTLQQFLDKFDDQTIANLYDESILA